MVTSFQGLRIKSPQTWPLAVALSFGLLLSACAQDLGSNTYSRSAVGHVNHTETGVVVSTRNVTIDGTNSRVGTGAGAIIGGVAGSNVGGSRDENIVGAVAGAVLGGLAGSAIEKGVTRQSGIEYTIRDQSGQIFTVVQTADSGLIYPGTPVSIIYGADRVRVVPSGYNQSYQGAYAPQGSYAPQGYYAPPPDEPRLIR